QAEQSARFLAGSGKLGGKIDSACRNNGALTGNEAWHGAECTDSAWVGERNSGTLKIGNLQLVGTGTGNNVVVCCRELRKGHFIGIFDVGNHQGSIAVLALNIHGKPDVDLIPNDAECFSAIFGEGVIEGRVRLESLDNGPRNQVRKAEFAFALQSPLLVNKIAIFFNN